MKECIGILLQSVIRLVNLSISESMWACGIRFQEGYCDTTHKKASLPGEYLNNYCHVSGLSFISIVVECDVAVQLKAHSVFIRINAPGEMHFSKWGATINAFFKKGGGGGGGGGDYYL